MISGGRGVGVDDGVLVAVDVGVKVGVGVFVEVGVNVVVLVADGVKDGNGVQVLVDVGGGAL